MLSPRQRELLQHVANGAPGKAAGDALGITHRTVRQHLTTVRRVLCARTTPHAIAIAIRKGLIQ